MDNDQIERWLTPDEELGLNNCDKEPIHLPGTIQPHGALCALDARGQVVMQSENLADYFERGGQGFDMAYLVECLDAIPLESGEREASDITIFGIETAVVGHRSDGLRIYEFEPLGGLEISQMINIINRGSQVLSSLDSPQLAFELAVREVRALTGFDRVVAYLFDEEGHGEVVAAEVSPNVDDFLHLKFPATDIPKQARRLYVLELTRQIVDVGYEPVEVSPVSNPVTGRPLNMAFCQLRSVSPIHLQYLKNMGVAASFSVSIVVEGELYALIACHHYSPRHLDFRVRQSCELLGRMLSQHFSSLEERRRRDSRSQQLAAQVELLCELGDAASLDTESKAWERAYTFVDAESMLVCLDGRCITYGVPVEQQETVVELGNRFAQEHQNKVHVTSSLSDYDERSQGGGLLLVPIGSLGWLGWYRQPEEQLVKWAGKPDLSGQKELTPRASFGIWQETIKGRSRAWSEEDQEMAEILRRGLVARFGESHSKEDSFERAMQQLREYVLYLEENTQAMQRINDDLRQFAYAASHDLRAPLRTVRSFLPLIRNEIPSLDVHLDLLEWLDYVENAADTLHRLQEGLWAFSRVNRVVDTEAVDLNALFERITKGLAADVGDAEVVVNTLPELRGVPSQIETLFRNLFDNAAKYRSPERRLRLVVDAYKEKGEWVISVSDNGIGFPPAAARRIFDLFTRVHTEQGSGDGLGLALCRRIAHHHNGWIRASSEPGLGSTFEVLLRGVSM